MTGPTHPLQSRQECVTADASDPLREFRRRFSVPENLVYLDGNSLGVLPKSAPERAKEIIETEWGNDLITSWNKNEWFALPLRLGKKIATLVGGDSGGCVATDTTSINIYKALGAALQIQAEHHPERRVILSERDNFPTDLYIIEGLIRFLDRGYELRLVDDELCIEDALDEDVAVTLLTQVNYRSGSLWDIQRVTRLAHEVGALTIWDLCHSAGALPISLDKADADFAVGCTYKYLNGGPGSPAFIWVAERYLADAQQPLSGWWGHARPFDMETTYRPARDIRSFLSGTQPIISLGTMQAGLDLALEADMNLVRGKSIALTTLFIELVETRLPAHPLTLITPRDPEKRGSHVSFHHPNSHAVMQALIAEGVVGDYREPDVLRFGITPLYIGYADVWDAVETLRRVLDEELWRAPEHQVRHSVT
ncbi:kynureninase [Pseudoclavibacter sp. AY1F1]|uniref:kynureninase n=1 Tax=Pseudoclavibacter sp. AY1F1 TaxID=2080583 RepID=UPI000CE82FAD|nr:kynureninase [Pseudoclavibacter sp. AY1F1]PPF44472.1 kynureninase [Pseudoclavibacter sp. AY1F1]